MLTLNNRHLSDGRDPNSAGSQFFIVHAEHAPHLDGQYSVFGVVEEGLEVLDEARIDAIAEEMRA